MVSVCSSPLSTPIYLHHTVTEWGPHPRGTRPSLCYFSMKISVSILESFDIASSIFSMVSPRNYCRWDAEPVPITSHASFLRHLFIIHINLSSLMFWSPHWIFSFWLLHLFKNFISSEVAQQTEAQANVYKPEPQFKTDQFWTQFFPPHAHMHLPTHKINKQINI